MFKSKLAKGCLPVVVTVGVVSVVAVEVVSDRVDLTDVVSVAINDNEHICHSE